VGNGECADSVCAGEECARIECVQVRIGGWCCEWVRESVQTQCAQVRSVRR